MPDTDSSSSTPRASMRNAKPHSTLLRLGLAPLIIHFRSTTGYITQGRLESYDSRILGRVKGETAKVEDVRYVFGIFPYTTLVFVEPYCLRTFAEILDTWRFNMVLRKQLGTDTDLWADLNEVLIVAVPSLSDRCMSIKPPTSANAPLTPEEPDSALIVSNYTSLLKDIARLNDLVAIARNVLTIGEVGQNLAAKQQFDASLFKLVTLCIKVSGRGFEFSGGTKEDERKWQLVVNDCEYYCTSMLGEDLGITDIGQIKSCSSPVFSF
jgi:hypothetical protein